MTDLPYFEKLQYQCDVPLPRSAVLVNHADEPNVSVIMVANGHNNLKHAIPLFIASRDIAPLEEITINYG